MVMPNATKADLMRGSIDLDTAGDTIKVLLLDDTTAYTADVDNHDFVSDVADGGVTGTEMSGTGYSRKTLANQAVTVDDTDNEGVFDADNVTWTGLNAGTIQTVVVYQQVGADDTTPADDRIIAIHDDSSIGTLPLTTNGSDVTLSWPAEGIVNLG
ncbi:MAG: hypothetical protein R3324_07580 [Halobacteriales archaeon]|nr:hypothetical protein [Halobacteriales archaeon]